MKIAQQLTELIGHTPLLALKRFSKENKLETPLIAKLEMYNPGGSSKDRPALAMLQDAAKKGFLSPGGTVIEPTSGNMGVGLAWVASVLGYHMIVVMPETMSEERRGLVRAFGADLRLSPGEKGMSGAIEMAKQLNNEIEGSVILGQFDNDSNPQSHTRTTAEEIWEDTEGTIDIFVAGVGTGGTISGVGKGLKQRNSSIQIIAVEPAASPVLTEGCAGEHKLQGLGANFIPHTYHPEYVDEIISVADDDAIATARHLAGSEGVLAGISSGAALYAATQVASKPENKGKNIVVLLPDTGERYLSTCEFDFENYPLEDVTKK